MTIEEKYKLAAELLKQDFKTIEENSELIQDLSAIYVSIPIKGGGSIIIADDGSVLYADSSVGYTQHVKAFKEGIRTPIEAFDI